MKENVMKLSFIRLNRDNLALKEESVAMALDGLHTYEFLDLDDCTNATGDYTFFMDTTYNVIALRNTIAYMEEVPGRDIYYPDFIRSSGKTTFIIVNAGFRIDESCPIGVIFRTEFSKHLKFEYNFDLYWITLSGLTLETCKIDIETPLGTAITVPTAKKSGAGKIDCDLSEELTEIGYLRRIEVINGRTWYVLDRHLQWLQRRVLTKINKDRASMGDVVYDKIYEKLLG